VEISFSKHITIPQNILFREIDDEAVILNIDSEHYYGLDNIGTRMWSLLAASETIQAAFDAMLAEYEVEPERLKADMEKLIKKLADKRLVVISDEDSK
jgi:hypothetical protein